jgi:sugar/nucleoside kinase (ribokinase family)
MTVDDMESYKERIEDTTPAYGAFLFGYPHLLPEMQGEALAEIMVEARRTMIEGGIVALDLNGVPEMKFERRGLLRSLTDLKADPAIGAALPHVDILHMNESELVLLTGCHVEGTDDSQLEDDYTIASAVNLFIRCGVAVVAVTRGKKGSFVCCNSEERFQQTKIL